MTTFLFLTPSGNLKGTGSYEPGTLDKDKIYMRNIDEY